MIHLFFQNVNTKFIFLLPNPNETSKEFVKSEQGKLGGIGQSFQTAVLLQHLQQSVGKAGARHQIFFGEKLFRSGFHNTLRNGKS